MYEIVEITVYSIGQQGESYSRNGKVVTEGDDELEGA